MKINLKIELKRVQYTMPEPILKYFTDKLQFNKKDIINFIQFIIEQNIKGFQKDKSVKSLLDNYIMDFIISHQFDINKEINKKFKEVLAKYNKIHDHKMIDIKKSDKLRNKLEKYYNEKKSDMAKFSKYTVKVIEENIDLEELTKSYKEEKNYMDYERKNFIIDKKYNESKIQIQEEELSELQEEKIYIEEINEVAAKKYRTLVKQLNEQLNDLNEDITALEAKKQQLTKETIELTLNLSQRKNNVK